MVMCLFVSEGFRVWFMFICSFASVGVEIVAVQGQGPDPRVVEANDELLVALELVVECQAWQQEVDL